MHARSSTLKHTKLLLCLCKVVHIQPEGESEPKVAGQGDPVEVGHFLPSYGDLVLDRTYSLRMNSKHCV